MATWEKVTKTVDVLHSSEPGSVLTGIKDHRKNHGLWNIPIHISCHHTPLYIYIFTLYYIILCHIIVLCYYIIILLYYYIIILLYQLLYYIMLVYYILYILYIYTLIPIENHTFSWYRRRFFSVSPHCHVEKFTCWQPVRRSGRENGMILEVDTPFLSTEELGGNSRSIMIYPVFFLWSKMINIFSKIFPDTLEPIMSWFDFRQNVGMRSAGCASAGGLARNAAPRHLAIQNTSVDLFLW